MIHLIYEIANTVNERYLTLEALIERFDWYHARGFSPLIEEEAINSNSEGLVFMVADLYDEMLVDKYLDE